LMIAAVLGATVDAILKIELVRDAFFAAFRYAFPPALQGEILRIMRYRLICDRHLLLVRIEFIDADTVRVTCETNRRITNVSSYAEKLKPYLHIDEWGFEQGKSTIVECRLEAPGGKPTINAVLKNTAPDPTILVEGREITLKPRQSAVIFAKWTEIRRSNDSVYIQFSHPTTDPEIEIPAVAGLKVVRSFGSASEEIEEVYTGRQVLSGTYLPHHYMVIRWWPIEA